MHVSITAVSDKTRGSGGKNISLGSSDFGIDVFKPGGTVKDHMTLSAKASENVGTGERLGIPFEIRRRVIITLERDDLRRILETAFAHKLVVLPTVLKLQRLANSLDKLCKQLGAPTASSKRAPTSRATRTRATPRRAG